MIETEYNQKVDDFFKLVRKLRNLDEFVIGCQQNKSEAKNFNLNSRNKESVDRAFCAVKYFPEKNVLVAWDLVRRREFSGTMNLYISIDWTQIAVDSFVGYAHYCTFENRKNRETREMYWDKVVVVGEQLFDDFFRNYENWLKFNSDDISFPSELEGKHEGIWQNHRERKKYAAFQRERDARFRQAGAKSI